MLLVVIGHVTLTNEFKNPATPVSAEIERIIYSFHMPLFMFISGFLFYYTKLSKNKSFVSVVKDKVKRLAVPFLFFTVCTLILKSVFSALMKNPAELSLQAMLDIITFKSNPLAEMWFISTLFLLFFFQPLYKWSLKSVPRVLLMLCFCVLMNIFFPVGIERFNLSNISEYIIYFYLGILFSKYNVPGYLDSKISLAACAVLFAIFNIYMKENISILTPLVGVLFSLSLCQRLSRHMPQLFSSFRDYTFQIFLMGIFFQIGIRFLYLKIDNETIYPALYLTSILLGIYLPVAISLIVKKIKYPTIRGLLGLN